MTRQRPAGLITGPAQPDAFRRCRRAEAFSRPNPLAFAPSPAVRLTMRPGVVDQVRQNAVGLRRELDPFFGPKYALVGAVK